MPNKQSLCRSASAVVYWRSGIVLLAFIFFASTLIGRGPVPAEGAPVVTTETVVFIILGIMFFYMITLDLTRLFTSYRNGQRWKNLTDRLELTPPAVHEVAPICNDLVDRSFNLVVPPEPPTSIVGKFLGQFLQCAIGILLGVGVSVLLRAGGNWLVIVAFIVGIIVLAVLSTRIHLLVSASKRSEYYRRSKANSAPNVAFFQCHVRALQLLGFKCIGGLYEDQTKKRIAVASSPDHPTWAELLFVREKDRWQASCQFKSLTNDGQLVTTETYPCEQSGSEISPQFMCDALHTHNVEVERYCLANQTKAAVIAADDTLTAYRYLAVTEKIKQQELVSGSADSVLSDWDWFPSWLRAPVVKFS